MKNLIKIVALNVLILVSFSSQLIAQKDQEIKIIPDVVYGHKDGLALTMDVYKPKEFNGAGVILINSGGFVSPWFPSQYKANTENEKKWILIPKDEIKTKLFQQTSFNELLNKGYTVFDVRHGSAPKYLLNEIVNDLHKAVKFIKNNSSTFNISKDRVGAWGASAGAYLAAYLTVNPEENNNIKTSVLYFPAGYDWLADRNVELKGLLPAINISDELLDSLSLKHYINDKTPPLMVLYGELDEPFITEPSELIISDLKSKNVLAEKIIYKNVGHVWLKTPREINTYDSEVGDKAMKNLIKWFDANL